MEAEQNKSLHMLDGLRRTNQSVGFGAGQPFVSRLGLRRQHNGRH
jgi:hypothetical protein